MPVVWAGGGFLAIALDLFSWGGRLRCIRALMVDLAKRKGVSFDDVDAVRQWLESRQDCPGKTGVVGFCATGNFAILLAAGHGFSAVAPNYGHVPNDIDAILDGACPVVASFGGRERPLKSTAGNTGLRCAGPNAILKSPHGAPWRVVLACRDTGRAQAAVDQLTGGAG